jgi:dihydroflavonol-4-reductase
MPSLPFHRWTVTGATGLVGNNVVRQLVERGAEVTVLVRGAGRRELAGLPVREVQGDLLEPDAVRRACAEAQVVVHAAADVAVRMAGRDAMRRVNVDGTRAVVAALPATARLLHVSTVDANGLGSRERPADEDVLPRPEEGGVPYVDTKREAEQVVRASGRDHIMVRPTYMIGPWDWRPNSGRMVMAVAAGKTRVAPEGGNNFVDVRDVAAAMIRAAEAPAGSTWILGNENLTYREAWSRMARVVGGPPPLLTLPGWLVRAAAGAVRALERVGLPEAQEVNGTTMRMSTIPHYFDPSRARAVLGMETTPLETAVAAAWTWFGEHGLRDSSPG